MSAGTAANTPGDGDHPGRRLDGVDSAAPVQRKVGFEFEAQYNVREKATDDETEVMRQLYEEERNDKINERTEALIDRQINDIDQQYFDENQHTYRDYKKLSIFKKLVTKKPHKLEPDWLARRAAYYATEEGRQQFWKTAEIQLLQERRITERFLPGKELSKLGTVVEGDRFNLTADTSPSGGAQLEWVVDPPCETEEEVSRVMDDITEQGNFLNAHCGDETIDAKLLDGVGSGQNARDVLIFPGGEPLSLAPQATGGIRLDQLGKMIEYVQGRGNGSEMTPEGRAKQMQALEDLNNNSQAAADTANTRGLMNRVKAAIAAVDTLPATERDETRARAELESLVLLMASYIVLGSHLKRDANSKSIAGRFLSRNDFCFNYELLAPEYQKFFRLYPEIWEEMVLEAAGMAGSGGEKLFPYGFEKGLAGHREHFDFPVTRAQWIDGVKLGVDWLRNYDKILREEGEVIPEDQENPIHKSLGALGSKREKVGPDDLDAVIIELRGMNDRKKVHELKPLALAVFRFIELVNEGGDITYEPPGS